MRTFRFSLVALAATALFTACSNDEAVQPIDGSAAQGISFRLQGGTPETRATATTKDNIDAFVVYGTDDVLYDDGSHGPAGNIFNGVTVARQEGGGFDYSPKKYYSNGATNAEFFAYSPVSANITASSIDATDLYSDASFYYVVKTPDLLNPGNTVQEDLLVAGTSVASPSGSAVDIDFKHALSRIFVKATNALEEDIIITKLVLKNLASEGTLTGTPGVPWAWTWTGHDNETDYEYILANSGVAVPKKMTSPTLVTSMEQGMMVLPQVTANDGNSTLLSTEFALEVTYDVANLTSQKALVAITNGFEFLMNTQYAITIDFDGTDLIEISFEIKVLPFDADPTNDYPL